MVVIVDIELGNGTLVGGGGGAAATAVVVMVIGGRLDIGIGGGAFLAFTTAWCNGTPRNPYSRLVNLRQRQQQINGK